MNTALLGSLNFDPTIPRAVVKVLCARHLAESRAPGRWFRADDYPQVESDAPCAACRDEAEYAALMDGLVGTMREAMLSPKLSHTRTVRGFVYAYHRDDTSPTGVMAAGSCEEGRYFALAAELHGHVLAGALSPLSPTER